MIKHKAIVCDIDSVLLKTDFILDEADKLGLYGDLKWDYFHSHCNDNNVKVIDNVKVFYNRVRYGVNPDVYFILLTARSELCADATLKRLAQDNIFCDKIYLRKAGDYRSACDVKREYLQEIMKDFDVICFIDDDIRNCEMAKELGILSLRVV